MPFNGDINSVFGVYRTVCCQTEIIIPAGHSFPDCPKHTGLTTQWKSIHDGERIPHVSELPKEPDKRIA